MNKPIFDKYWSPAFDTTDEFVLLIDKNYNIVKYNEKFAEFSKVKRDYFIGKKCYEVLHDTDEPEKKCPHHLVIGTKRFEGREFFEEYLKKWLYVRVTPIFDDEHNFIGTIHMISDISEQKAAQDQLIESKNKLEEALRIKSDFTSTVSHELRTPLAAIKEGIAIVLDGTAGEIDGQQKEFLDIAKRNVDRLSRLINDILDFQKLEAGKMVFNPQENDLNEIIKEVGQTMVPLAEEKGLELTLDLEDSLPKIQFDRDKIIQVLINIVNNAIKFTEKGDVRIATSQEDNIVTVSVKDTGTGIKEEDLPKLFQPFEQLQKGIERNTGGTGLGLAISKDIIEKHHGKIWAESEFNKGTAIHFILPVKDRRA